MLTWAFGPLPPPWCTCNILLGGTIRVGQGEWITMCTSSSDGYISSAMTNSACGGASASDVGPASADGGGADSVSGACGGASSACDGAASAANYGASSAGAGGAGAGLGCAGGSM